MLPILGKEFQGIDDSSKSRLPQNFPEKFIPAFYYMLKSIPNETTDFSKPYARTSLQRTYPLFITLYMMVMVIAVVTNSAMFYRILNIVQKLQERKMDMTEYLFLANIAILNILLSFIVIPLSLAILLIQNWVLGKTVCYLAPILQVYNKSK